MDYKAPSAYGFPPKFTEWREIQKQAISSLIESKKRFLFQALPTGSGKSLAYIGASKIGGFNRTIVLTASKVLQDQLVKDFGAIGLFDIRGMANYDCYDNPSLKANEAKCTSGIQCNYKDSNCEYYQQIRRAKTANLVVTNYQFWMTINKAANGELPLGPFDLLVMDEAHLAPQILFDFYTYTIDAAELKSCLNYEIPKTKHRQDIIKFLNLIKLEGLEELAKLKYKVESKTAKLADFSKLAKMSKLQRSIEDASSRMENDFYGYAIDLKDEKATALRVGIIKPFPLMGESTLFNGCKKVLGVSATLRRMTVDLLGIRKEDYDFQEYPACFDPSRNPVIHVKSISINYNTSENVIRDYVIPKLDQFISNRLDRKGIIHVTSYKYAEMIKAYSVHSSLMFFPNRFNAKSIIESFRNARAPSIIVSPALTQGYDFPYDSCEFQIIFKLPWPSFGDELFKQRIKYNANLANYLTMQSLVQQCGRGMRAEDDSCENVIFDDQIETFVQRSFSLFPIWFIQSFKSVQISPSPLPKIQRKK